MNSENKISGLVFRFRSRQGEDGQRQCPPSLSMGEPHITSVIPPSGMLCCFGLTFVFLFQVLSLISSQGGRRRCVIREESRERIFLLQQLSTFCIGSSFLEVPEPTLSHLRCFLKDCSINGISSSLLHLRG